MPSRRCPHCKVIASYGPVDNVHLFDNRRGQFIRLEACRDEHCGCVSAVVYPSSGCPADQVVDIYPALDEEPDEHLPQGVKIAFSEAMRSLNEGIWNGCVLMCRRALEEAVADLGATGKVLFDKIDNLASEHKITPDLAAWAHETRLAGKLGAHGVESDEKKWNEEVDAQEIVEFSRWFFRYVYVLPKQLEERRARIDPSAQAASATQ
jgi:hypothetical protein